MEHENKTEICGVPMEHENKICEGINEDELLVVRHFKQQQHHQNRFYGEIEAQHGAASNSTRLDLVAKVMPKAPVEVDDGLILILARLPAKSLQKFRCVCKSWNSLIQQDHHFISLHQLHLNHNNKKQPPSLVTLFATSRTPYYRGLESCVLNYSSSDTTTPYKMDFTRFLPEEDPFDFTNPSYFLTNSCNGLLGVYSCHSFFIVNPTIRKLKPLPTTCAAPARCAQAALGFDTSTGVYKVVRIFDRERDVVVSVGFGCEVCYLGGDGSEGWKSIDDPPVKPSYDSLPVVVDGAIIWASEAIRGDREVVALSFDLREEKFSVILHPEVSSRPTVQPKSHVFVSEGHICVADEIPSPVPIPYMHIRHLNIWLLMKEEDHDKKKKKNSNKWVKQYVVDLTYVFENFGPFLKAQPLTTDHNGRIVIYWGQGRILYYDPQTGSFDKHELDATRVGGEEHIAPYTEGIVWPCPRLYGSAQRNRGGSHQSTKLEHIDVCY
ncbi:F-box protein-like [Iris pallida]|uniref:F-box protein-like n=1 Tax=Iris pallida TaxID=29817 RepID=A0AAX6E0D4_IRIPA|nr:F-box protein-like [Iris pallida]